MPKKAPVTHEIKLTVTDKQLEKFKKAVEESGGGKVLDALGLMTEFFKNELAAPDVWVEIVLDGGGNSVGDVLPEGEFDHLYDPA